MNNAAYMVALRTGQRRRSLKFFQIWQTRWPVDNIGSLHDDEVCDDVRQCGASPGVGALKAHHASRSPPPICASFSPPTRRAASVSRCEAAGIYFDYSKNRITDETLELLLRLAEESDLRGHIDAMFAGQPINVSENRAVMHVALRAPRGATLKVAA